MAACNLCIPRRMRGCARRRASGPIATGSSTGGRHARSRGGFLLAPMTIGLVQ
jgi:hypothetical protein